MYLIFTKIFTKGEVNANICKRYFEIFCNYMEFLLLLWYYYFHDNKCAEY